VSQNNNFAYHLRNKKVNWPDIIQQPVNAASRRIGMKTARPGVDYRPQDLE